MRCANIVNLNFNHLPALVQFVLATWFANYDYLCSKYNKQSRVDPKETRVINIYWVFLVSKVIEFMDTTFMILRKKQNQVTFLHTFHHVSVLNIWWAVVLFIPGGQCESRTCQ